MRRLLAPALACLIVGGLLPQAAVAFQLSLVGQQYTVPVDGTLTATLFGNGGTTAFTIDTPPAHGTLGTIAAPTCRTVAPLCWATVTYTPDAAYQGADGFTYDALGATPSSSTVAIEVAASNQPPVVDDDAIAWPEDEVGSMIGLLDGAADPDGDTIVGRVVTQPEHATVTLDPDGLLTIVPEADYARLDDPLDSFTIAVSDGVDESVATVTLDIFWLPDAPSFTAGRDVNTTEDAGPVVVSGWASEVRSGPANEEAFEQVRFVVEAERTDLFSVQPSIATVVDPGAGASSALAFTPAPNANGSTEVTVTAWDNPEGWPEPEYGDVTSETVTFTITVAPVNDAPGIAAPSTLGVAEDSLLPFGEAPALIVLSDVDLLLPNVPENPPPPVQELTLAATNGTLSLNAGAEIELIVGDGDADPTMTIRGTVADLNDLLATPGALGFLPSPGFGGAAAIALTLDDLGVYGSGGAKTATATISIDVAGENDAPVAAHDEDTVTILEDSAAVTIDVLANDTDPDGDGLLVTGLGPSSRGVAAVATGGTHVTYTPNPDANGFDGFSYTISDGNGGTATAFATFTITAVNDAPSFTKGADQAVAEDSGQQTVTGWATGVAAGPADEAGQTLTFTLVAANPALFSVQPAVQADTGTLTFTPAANRFGSTTVTVTLADDAGTANGGANVSGAQAFTISITPVNDAPIASNDVVTVTGILPAALAVRANDTGGPNEPADTYLITSVTQGGKGSVTITGGGTGLTYDPRGCNTGGDTFTYTLVDGHGATDTATVLVTIRPITTSPQSDAPASNFVMNSTIGTTVPVRTSWCATAPGPGIRSQQLQRRINSNAFLTTSLPSTTATTVTQNLTVGTTYRYRTRATDTLGRTGAWATGPIVRVLRYQDSSTSVRYSGTWRVQSTSAASGGTLRYATAAGARATLTFTGRQVAIVAPRSSTRGSFRVRIDGVLVSTVSLRSTTTASRRVVFVRSLAQGTHTIQLEAVGNGRVDLDAILVLP